VEPALVEFLPSLALAIALASCAGLRAFLPLLLTGAVARAGYLELGPGFQFLASDRALLLFGLAALLEFAGDKLPVVDHALDAIGTLLRPAAGALLAASVMWRVEDPLVALVLGIVVGAPAAIVPHAAKSTLRTVSTAFTAGLANPLISLLEDAIAIGLFALAVLVPLLVAVLVVATALWLARRLRQRPRRPATAS
jgi:hypothetical protein